LQHNSCFLLPWNTWSELRSSMNRAFDLPLLVSSKLSKYLISFKVQPSIHTSIEHVYTWIKDSLKWRWSRLALLHANCSTSFSLPLQASSLLLSWPFLIWKYTLLLYKFMPVDLSYLPFTISNDGVSSERIALYLTGISRVRVDRLHYEEKTEL
jgi:hypothetical protein